MEFKEQIYAELLEGAKQKDVAGKYKVLNRKGELVPMTTVQVTRLFTIEEKATFTEKRKVIHKRETKYLKKLEENVFTTRQPRIVGMDVDKGLFDLWNYPDNYKSMNKFGEVVEIEDVFGNSTLNIPYIEFQPAKRIQQVSHSIVKWIGTMPKLTGVTNFVHLMNPEDPLVKVQRHDVDTMNATIGFASSEHDSYLTGEDACIISTEFAKRFNFEIQTPQTIIVTEADKNDIEATMENRDLDVWAGENWGNSEFPDLEKHNAIKQDGIWRITTIKPIKDSDRWVVGGIIDTKRGLLVGDKLRSLSGMKVVICEIRDQNDNKDIIIHPNQIDSKTGVKGAMVKELLESGKVMVGMRQDEYIGANENLTASGSLSADLYPLMKIYTPDLLKKLLRENSLFIDYLKALHLAIEDNMIKISPKEFGIQAGHYCWTEWNLEHPDSFIGNISDYRLEDVTWGDEIHRVIAWEKLYIPAWVNQGEYRDRKWRDPEYLPYRGNTFDENRELDEKYQAKIPYLHNPHRKREGKAAKGELNLPKTRLFPKIRSGCILRAIPANKGTKEIVLSEFHREQFNEGIATIWREPVVGINNVYSVKVRFDETLNPFVVKIPMEYIKAAFGDTDGDTWSVIPNYDEGFSVKTHNIGAYEFKMVKNFDIHSLKLIEQTSEELVDNAIKWKAELRQFKYLTQKLGGLRKTSSFWAESVVEQKEIIKMAAVLESTLKPELFDEDLVNDTIIALEEFIPTKLNEQGRKVRVQNPLSAIEGKFKRNVWRSLPGTKIPGFWIELIGKQDLTGELREGKTIYLGGI